MDFSFQRGVVQVGYSNMGLADLKMKRMKGAARTVFGLKIKASGNLCFSLVADFCDERLGKL